MIRWIRGPIHQVLAHSLVVEIGGMGIAVQCTPATAMSVRVGEAAELNTSFVVRDDGWTMYGFLDPEERDLFDIVQTVSGIGPRIALTLLATLTPDEVRIAIGNEDLATLTKVPGIGKKGAQRMVLELKDKVGQVGAVSDATSIDITGWQGSVKAGLMSLGWSATVADEAVATLPEPDGDPNIPQLLKAALMNLDRR
jgi:holliday junction DNA helicase RuvA